MNRDIFSVIESAVRTMIVGQEIVEVRFGGGTQTQVTLKNGVTIECEIKGFTVPEDEQR